ncbi:MAG: helix-turn-helix domain-containing protein [Candidatus Margulisbacteria bacterium]|jgi:transcriptional regulator with XRE-family HTH domain|nr:helix-turn-helix domain-containing protein [Candidatus Margulisiibacteriota bacterium]
MSNIQKLQLHIGKRLKELRQKKGLTMEVLTGLLDIDFSNYVYLEKGHTGVPRLDILLKLTDFYGVPIDYLFLNYKAPLEKPLKTSRAEQRLLTVFRKMSFAARLACLEFLNKLPAKNKK